jgi:hypothetical protein
MTEKRPRGRPSHTPTDATKRKVSIAAGAGITRENIALSMGIDRDTLAKHYEHELTVVAQERCLAVVLAVYDKAVDGNTSAAKLYLQGIAKPEPVPTPTDASLEIVSMPSQATGVKAQRNEDAKVAQQGTEWASLLPSSVQ